jgi:hypothetical protein
MKVLRMRQLRAGLAPAPDALERVHGRGRAPHALQHRGAGVLERDVEVGQHPALGHQRQHLVDVRVGIDVVHAHPGAQLAEAARQVEEARLVALAAPGVGQVPDVRAVGAGVLRDDQQLAHPGAHEALGLAQHLADGAAGEPAAQAGDDAEAALVVAALGNLQVGVVARRQADALRRHEVGERVVGRGQVLVHRRHDLLVGVRPRDAEHAGMPRADGVRLRAEAAGDQHLAVGRHRLADRLERLLDRVVDEAAGVDHDEVGVLVGRDGLVTLRAQPGEDALGVHERLGAAEADETDATIHGRVCYR